MQTDHDQLDLDGLAEGDARRVRLTVSCRDTDVLPKVAGAGEISERDGVRIQTMHNGVLVQAGGYFGAWMSEIIRTLRGHHEPQEEVVFAAVLDRLAASAEPAPVMVEPGCFWAYYSVWFARRFPAGRVLAIEPDPDNLAVGRHNAALNEVSDRIDFRAGMVGPGGGQRRPFVSETTGQVHDLDTYDLADLLAATGTSRIDLLACDIQGAETALLEAGVELLAAGAVRFLIVSTHHHSISGDPLTHDRALAAIAAAGGTVIAEHTVAESFSGDGLIAASFDPRDADFRVAVSHARSSHTLFPPLEHELAAAWAERTALAAERDVLSARLDAARQEVAAAAAAIKERDAMANTRVWRLSRRPAQLCAALGTRLRTELRRR